MADGLDVMCETNREVKDNAKSFGVFDLSNWLKLMGDYLRRNIFKKVEEELSPVWGRITLIYLVVIQVKLLGRQLDAHVWRYCIWVGYQGWRYIQKYMAFKSMRLGVITMGVSVEGSEKRSVDQGHSGFCCKNCHWAILELSRTFLSYTLHIQFINKCMF